MTGSPPSSAGLVNATFRNRSPAVTDVIDGAVGAVAAARVTVTVVVVDTPVFVATTGITFAPTESATAGDATPEVTAAPSTVSVVDTWFLEAVSLIEVVV